MEMTIAKMNQDDDACESGTLVLGIGEHDTILLVRPVIGKRGIREIAKDLARMPAIRTVAFVAAEIATMESLR